MSRLLHNICVRKKKIVSCKVNRLKSEKELRVEGDWMPE